MDNLEKLLLYNTFENLRKIVYNYHSVGGALHIVLDDYNVDDDHLKFCYKEVQKTDDPDWYKIVMLAILAMLAELDIETRLKFVEGSVYDD